MTLRQGPGGQRLDKPRRITQHESRDDIPPLVSVACTTFNHSRFIRECLDGFLMQETSFPFEILVHDDASTDGTADIVREYRDRYPHLIRATLQTENQYSRGAKVLGGLVATGRGEYVATCEGDDYWISATKLEQQVAMFEQHADCLLCGGRAFVQRDGARTPYTVEPSVSPEDLARMGPTDMLQGRLYFKTLTRMNRRSLWDDYLRLTEDHTAPGDYLFILYCIACAQSTSSRFYCLDDVVAVYREHAGGLWSGSDEEAKLRWNISVLTFALARFDFAGPRESVIAHLAQLCEYAGISSTGVSSVDELLSNHKKAQRLLFLRRSLWQLRAAFR